MMQGQGLLNVSSGLRICQADTSLDVLHQLLQRFTLLAIHCVQEDSALLLLMFCSKAILQGGNKLREIHPVFRRQICQHGKCWAFDNGAQVGATLSESSQPFVVARHDLELRQVCFPWSLSIKPWNLLVVSWKTQLAILDCRPGSPLRCRNNWLSSN